jgi:hypothetical protein
MSLILFFAQNPHLMMLAVLITSVLCSHKT